MCEISYFFPRKNDGNAVLTETVKDTHDTGFETVCTV